MSESLIVLVPLVVLALLLLFPFIGCFGDDPRLGPLQKERDDAKAEAEELQNELAQIEQEKAESAEASKYDRMVLGQKDLVSYWRLDEPDAGSTVAKDSAPDDPRHGEYKLVQGLTFGQAGALSSRHAGNMAVEFLGTQGFVEVPYHPLLNPAQDFTIEAWFLLPKPPEPVEHPQVIVGSYQRAQIAQAIRGYVIELVPGTPLAIRAQVGDGTKSGSVTASLHPETGYNGWHHVVATYSGSVERLRLYLDAYDAKFDDEASPTTGTPVSYAENSAAPLRIGAGAQDSAATGGGTAAAFFRGHIDEVALYRVALSGVDVQKHLIAAITP
jgi:hypothetical protein